MEAPLLIEIGCEEIPARMIAAAAEDLGSRVARILDQAGLAHGQVRVWGGSRRLAVRVDSVESRQEDREETLIGPPAPIAFDEMGAPTRAAAGFAAKQGVEPSALIRVETERGSYCALHRSVRGAGVGELLAEGLPAAVEGMTFPKTMRWGDGTARWVRPVHWVLALHDREVLPVTLFGIRAEARSRGHRFLAPGPVPVEHPDRYRDALHEARVLVDPAERKQRIEEGMRGAAAERGAEPVEDAALLAEVSELVEWPGIVVGRFEEAFLELPREILTTTLRHHQKSFSVQKDGRLVPLFLSVANTDRDPAGHIRRGNEWVVGGRLDDARFFWNEDRRRPLEARVAELETVRLHTDLGTYRDKAERIERVAEEIAGRLGFDARDTDRVRRAALLAKADLVTGLVGEFPELQGVIGGLLLRDAGEDPVVAEAVATHYRPAGPDDPLPAGPAGRVVSVADKLDTVGAFLRIGLAPTGSRDPYGLRRAVNGVFRIVEEGNWPLSLRDLATLAGDEGHVPFLRERHAHHLRERGYAANEIEAVRRPAVDSESETWPLGDIVARLEAIKAVRGRRDFEELVALTKRVENILVKSGEAIRSALDGRGDGSSYREDHEAAIDLARRIEEAGPRFTERARARDYAAVVDLVAGFIGPVSRFFDEVLVVDPDRPEATFHRGEILDRLKTLLVGCFDIRELAGQADRRS